MRFPFALLIFGGLVAGTIVAQAAEADMSCAATFSTLSQSARSQGLPSGEFDRMAAIAAEHGGAVTFAGRSQVRAMSLPQLQAQVVNCHARYDGKGGLRIASS